jgi:hypothetical protein
MIEKKLILCSILAIAIGIATIVPLAFIMSPAKAQTDTDDQPQFSFDLQYAYVRDCWNTSTLTNDTYGWAFALAFKTSPNFNVSDLDSKVIYETYRAEVSSEKGSIGNISLSTFATPNTNPPMNFTLYLDQWYNFSDSKDSAGRAGSENGASIGFKNGFGENWDLTSGEPQTLTITIYRDTWIIRSVNSTEIFKSNPEAIQQVQLQKYGNGFLYNTAIPQNELDTINPLFPALKMSY